MRMALYELRVRSLIEARWVSLCTLAGSSNYQLSLNATRVGTVRRYSIVHCARAVTFHFATLRVKIQITLCSVRPRVSVKLSSLDRLTICRSEPGVAILVLAYL